MAPVSEEEFAAPVRFVRRSSRDSPSIATVPADFQAALDQNPPAQAFFETLDRANRYAILWRIQTVKKAETRARKIEHFTRMLERGEKIHLEASPS